MARQRGSALGRELCAIYVLLIAYATLHPLTGWRDRGVSPLAWLEAWPRITLPFDLALNVAAYVPFGFLFVRAAMPALRGVFAVVLALLCGALLSCVLESLQTYLPSRTPSLADFVTNAAGAAAGAVIGALWVWMQGRSAGGARGAWIGDSSDQARALILAGLWMFAILYPESILFGHGSLVGWLGPVTGYPFTPAEFSRVESAVTAASLFAAGSLMLRSLEPGAPRLAAVIVFVFAACAARTLSQAVLFPPEHLWAWLTPGAQRGLGFGAVALFLTVALPQAMRLTLIVIAVTFATVVVNFVPANPYYSATIADLNPGRFLNFNGLTQLVSALWPFAVALYAPFALAARSRS
jgi:VanZ family protein